MEIIKKSQKFLKKINLVILIKLKKNTIEWYNKNKINKIT